MQPNRLRTLAAASLLAIALAPAASAAVPAATDGVVLNEVLAHPDEGAEAVELYNPTTEDLDVTGWTLQDDETFCIPREEAPETVTLNGTVPAGGTKVVRLPNPVGGFSCNALAQGDEAVLLHDASGVRVDAVCWGDACQAHPDAHEAPAEVPRGNTSYRCFLFSGEGEGLADEDLGEVDWTSGAPSLGQANDPCPF